MSEINRAIARRCPGSVSVKPTDSSDPIPSLEQWARDYVDLRSVFDGQIVLAVEVHEGEVVAIWINGTCTTKRATQDAQADNRVHIEYGSMYDLDHPGVYTGADC